MSDEISPLREWFWIVTTTLQREDLFLRRCLQPYVEGAYDGWSHGIINIYEPTIGYLLLRELWRVGFPRAISWEHPYPDGLDKRADLAIFHQRPQESIKDCSPEHVIEIKKMWFEDKGRSNEVWQDILKLLRFANACHRYVLLLIFGPEGATLKDEIARLQEKCIENQIDKVSEIFWEEFETRVQNNKPGRVRISLTEVFRRS